jgi:hypothetical protein
LKKAGGLTIATVHVEKWQADDGGETDVGLPAVSSVSSAT